MSETSTDLVLPHSGELVDLTSPRDVGLAIEQIRALEGQLRDVKTVLTAVLVEESSKRGSRTLRFGDAEYSLSSGSVPEWDIEELEKLLDLGLPADRWNDLVSTVVTYKVNASEAKRIAATNESYRAVIERARHDTPKPVYVSVKRSTNSP